MKLLGWGTDGVSSSSGLIVTMSSALGGIDWKKGDWREVEGGWKTVKKNLKRTSGKKDVETSSIQNPSSSSNEKVEAIWNPAVRFKQNATVMTEWGFPKWFDSSHADPTFKCTWAQGLILPEAYSSVDDMYNIEWGAPHRTKYTKSCACSVYATKNTILWFIVVKKILNGYCLLATILIMVFKLKPRYPTEDLC